MLLQKGNDLVLLADLEGSDWKDGSLDHISEAIEHVAVLTGR